jgi:hypothetical protein
MPTAAPIDHSERHFRRLRRRWGRATDCPRAVKTALWPVENMIEQRCASLADMLNA